MNIELPQRNSSDQITDNSDIGEDVNSISKILNCGNELNLQDFSEKIKNKYSSNEENEIPLDSPFVKVTLSNNDSIIIKKSFVGY